MIPFSATKAARGCSWRSLAVLAALIITAEARTFFNTPNQVDLNGNKCPLPVRKNVQCPTLCTTDQTRKNCPTGPQGYLTQCPTGQQWCVDGQCHATCTSDLVPVCNCPKAGFVDVDADKEPAGLVYPCSTTEVKADVAWYLQDSGPKGNTTLGDMPLRLACAANFQSTISPNLFFNECRVPPPSRGVQSPFAPEFVVAYGIALFESVIILLHYFYKKVRERNFREASNSPLRTSSVRGLAGVSDGSSSPTKPGSPFLDGHEVELGEMGSSRSAARALTANLTFKGYRSEPVGAAVGATVTVTSFVWIILLAVLVLDYYAVFAGLGFREESDMVFYDHDLLSSVFILVWHLVTIWFIALKLGQNTSTAYYGMRVTLGSARWILVEKKEEKAVRMANMGPLVEWIWKVESQFRKTLGLEVTSSIVPVEYTSGGRRFIEFECVRYVFNDRYGTFEPYSFPIGPKTSDVIKQAVGLSSSDASDRIELVGPNAVAFPADTFYTALGKEFSGIFYVYQMMALWIWYYYAYYYMGIVLTIVIVVSGIVKVIVYMRAQARVLAMASFTGSVRALRNGRWVTLSTLDVVPGDVIEVQGGDSHAVPVDAILVDGGAVCDESSLTGEALPVVKFPVRKDDTTRIDGEGSKNHMLYAGCHVLQTQPSKPNEPVQAIVVATGANTSKGRLVKDILYPSSVSFVFTEHLKIVFPLLMLWGVVMLLLSMAMLGDQGVDSWFYGMFTISQILSPLLPSVLVIGQSVASERLAKRGILCVDLDRITLAGKVKVFCFDKTGTLTKEGLNFLGVQPVGTGSNGVASFGAVMNEFTSFPDFMRKAMLTCHSVSTVGKTLVGNFVDVEMFRATGADLSVTAAAAAGDATTTVHPTTPNDRKMIILKRFEFVHSHAYMSVVVLDQTDNTLTVFLKGSFEKVRDLCDQSSIPDDYDSVARYHAAQGCYVLAFAKRELPAHISAEDVLRMSRSELEAGASLAGLVLFRNELKFDTADALDELRDGGCRIVMITGDNADTACFVAKAAGIIRPTMEGEPIVIKGDVEAGSVKWKNIENGQEVSWSTLGSMLNSSSNGGRPVELAVTGKAFNILNNENKMRDLLFDTRIFARMSPEDKVNCVRLHMERAVTAMCGDGGNDAGALKAAHAGIALSEAESSVVSHFSSRNRSIHSCIELLREARCSLDVSFASYKYLIMYGEILAFVGLVQYYFTVNMSQVMWVLIDGTTVPLSWALTMAKPALRLAPTRPTGRLLGPETIVSVVGAIVINIVFLIIAVVMLYGQSFFRCNEFEGNYADIRRWWELGDNYEGAVTGFIGVLQIIHAAAIFNIGRTYRMGFFRNWVFIAIWLSITAGLSFIVLADPNPLSCLFHINCGTSDAIADLNATTGTSYSTSFIGIKKFYHSFSGHNIMPPSFRWQLWGLSMANFGALALFQWLVVLTIGRSWAMKRWPLKRLKYKV